MLAEEFEGAARGEDSPTGEHFKGQQRQRILVCSTVGCGAGSLFGGGVERGSEEAVAGDGSAKVTGDAEVEDFGLSIECDADVFGFKVLMNDASGVGGIECVGKFEDDGAGLFQREGTAFIEDCPEGATADIFKYGEAASCVGSEVMHDSDAAVIERGGELCFACE